MSNIWRTSEFKAWSRDFNYEEYLKLHRDLKCEGAVVSLLTYNKLCVVMNDEMEESWKD